MVHLREFNTFEEKKKISRVKMEMVDQEFIEPVVLVYKSPYA